MNPILSGIVLALLLLLQIGGKAGMGGVAGTGGGPSPFNPCLVSAWPMNEGSGLTLHDTSIGGTNTATISGAGAVTWTANLIKSGVTSPSWNASGNALATSTTLTNFTGSTPFSVSVWANPSPSSSTLFGTLNTGSNFIGWELAVKSVAGPPAVATDFFLINNYPSNAIDIQTTSTLSGLNYIVVTYDGSKTAAGSLIYINGFVQTTSINANTLTASTASGLPVRFGARNNATEEFSGAMGFAEVYNCVLTPTQIATYNAAGPGIY